MKIEGNDFTVTVTQNATDDDLPSGHATAAWRRKTLNKDIVEKIPNPRGVFANLVVKWRGKMQQAKRIVDEIRAKKNPAYDVPKTFISHDKVYEEFASGKLLRDMPQRWIDENKGWIINAVAEFINDMSELRPVKYENDNPSVGMVGVKNIDELSVLLNSRGEDFLSEKDKKLILDVFTYLRDLPENKTFIFGHNDLHFGNIFVDVDNRRVSIIDFDMAGYKSLFYTMYTFFDGTKEMWAKVDRLPRAKNPNLRWDYDADIFELNKFLRWVVVEMRVDRDLNRLKTKINKQCEYVRRIFATVQVKKKAKSVEEKSMIVPMSHYSRD